MEKAQVAVSPLCGMEQPIGTGLWRPLAKPSLGNEAETRCGMGVSTREQEPLPLHLVCAPCCSPLYMPVNLFQRQQILPGSHITPPLRLSGAFCCFNITIAFSLLFLWVMQMMAMPSLMACFGIRMAASKFASQHNFFFFLLFSLLITKFGWLTEKRNISPCCKTLISLLLSTSCWSEQDR